MTSFRLTVPGNLLLAGEYAVLEEGGLGAALAVEPRLTVTAFPSDRWLLVGRWAGGEEAWDPESGLPPPFAARVFLHALELLEARGGERRRQWTSRTKPARLEFDSSPFFDAAGRKRGFGSSAALAAGVTAALAVLAGRDADESVHPLAVAAHRFAQGGAGSGYDVSASWFGGFGLFIGGVQPRWEPADPNRLPALAVFSGPQAVRTTSSIALYSGWKAQEAQAARDFLDASNAAVRTLVSGKAFVESWSVARDLGLELGRRIGSPAELPPVSGAFVKALGAGNETGGAVFEAAPPWPEGFERLTVSEGLRWE